MFDYYLLLNKKFWYLVFNKELSGENGMDCLGRKYIYKLFYNYWSKYFLKNVNIIWSMVVSWD